MVQNNFISEGLKSGKILKRILGGGAIGFILMGIFLQGVEGDPAWGDYWKVRPMIITPLAAAMGGAFFYLMEFLGRAGGGKRIFFILIGILGFIIALWLGSVLGLDGTLWN